MFSRFKPRDRCSLNGRPIGPANSRMVVAASTITFNGTGLQRLNGGNIYSYQDNVLVGNTTDGTPNAVFTPR